MLNTVISTDIESNTVFIVTVSSGFESGEKTFSSAGSILQMHQ